MVRVGRVRIGFDIDGIVYYAHEFLHANVLTIPYTQTLNLPIRGQLTTTAGVAASMKMVYPTRKFLSGDYYFHPCLSVCNQTPMLRCYQHVYLFLSEDMLHHASKLMPY